jgi:catechol 2,3-dioxygenase
MSKPPRTLAFSHLGFFVRDLEKMSAFYKRVLGFVETDRGVVRGMPIVFLSRDPREHHQIVLVEGRTGSLDDRVLNQISLRVGSLQDLRDLNASIAAEPEVSDINPVSHGNAWSVYFRDPEGNRIEVFTDSPWYVEQPMLQPLDLSQSDDEILEATRAAISTSPKFRPVEEWRADFARKLDESLN